MRGATGVTIQPHRILRLSRRKSHILSPHHMWNLIYNAWSNRCPPPTSPNISLATKNDIPKFLRKSLKTDETFFTMRWRSENDPSMIREWNRQSATRLATEVTFRAHREHFLLKNTTFCAQSYIQHIHEVLRLPRKVTLERHQVLHLPRKVTLQRQTLLYSTERWMG